MSFIDLKYNFFEIKRLVEFIQNITTNNISILLMIDGIDSSSQNKFGE